MEQKEAIRGALKSAADDVEKASLLNEVRRLTTKLYSASGRAKVRCTLFGVRLSVPRPRARQGEMYPFFPFVRALLDLAGGQGEVYPLSFKLYLGLGEEAR